MRTIVCGRWNRFSSIHPETRALRLLREPFELAEGNTEYKKLRESQELRDAQEKVTALVMRELENCGVSYAGDGGIRWDSIYDIAREIEGCDGFTQLTRIPETNHFHRQPVVTLPLSWRGPILKEDYETARKYTTKPVVLCLPGPYSLAHQTQNAALAGGSSKVADAYADVLNKEIKWLLQNGAMFVRIEEPHILFKPQDFSRVIKLEQRLMKGIDRDRVALATWFGDIDRFPNYFKLPFGIFCVDFVKGKGLRSLKGFPRKKRLVAGVMDAQNTYMESTEELAHTLREILTYVPEERVLLAPNTDLHFLPWDKAVLKVKRLVNFANNFKELSALQKITSRGCVRPEKLWRRHEVPFPTSAVGSYPQNTAVRAARLNLRKGDIDKDVYEQIIREETKKWMRFQGEMGITVPVSGELWREDMAFYFSTAFDGKAGDFVPSFENRRYRQVEFDTALKIPHGSLTVEEFAFAQSRTPNLVKATITGPATLADWASPSYKRYYDDPRMLRMDLARMLEKEIVGLIEAGARIIQVDEPALTTKSAHLALDLRAIEKTVEDFENRAYFILHICYSDMKALDAAFPDILKLPFDQIHMEMANRQGALLDLIRRHGFGNKDIGLGVVDVHSDRIETVEEIVAVVQNVLPYFSPDQIWITPDCGLKERSDEITKKKLAVMTLAAERCREEFAKK